MTNNTCSISKKKKTRRCAMKDFKIKTEQNPNKRNKTIKL